MSPRTAADTIQAVLPPLAAEEPEVSDPSPEVPEHVTYHTELFGVARARGRTSPRRAPAFIALLAVALGAIGWVVLGPGASRADAAHYARLFTDGERHRYRFQMTMDGAVEIPNAGSQTMRMDMDMAYVERTLRVSDDGVADVRARITDLSMTLDGERVSVPVGDLTIDARVAPNGKVLSVEGGPFGLGQAGPATNMIGPEWMGPLLPSDAVAPGDSWTITERFPLPFGDGAIRATAENKLVALRPVGGHDAAVISSTITVPMDVRVTMAEMIAAMRAAGQPVPDAGLPRDAAFAYDGSMRMDLVQTVERATGRPLSVVGDGVMDMGMRMTGIPGGDQRVTMRMDLDVSLHQV